jgi:uncharacterized protein (TIGR03437 family)
MARTRSKSTLYRLLIAPGVRPLAALACVVAIWTRIQAVVPSTAAAATPVIYSVVNAASFARGPLAPGEVITVFGDGLGPATSVSALPNAAGRFGTVLGATRIMINGLFAPVLYASNGQVTGVVPFSVVAGTPVTVQVEYQSIDSTPLIARIAQASPALFTATQRGTDQVAALNQDGSVNSAQRPASPGSAVALFVSGGGGTRAATPDGTVVGSALESSSPVTATVGGGTADVLYAGSAPGLIAGIFQVNVRLPQSTPAGNHVFVSLNIAGV